MSNISKLDSESIRTAISQLGINGIDIDKEGINIIQEFQSNTAANAIAHLEGFKYYKLCTLFIDPCKKDARDFTYSISTLPHEERLILMKERGKEVNINKKVTRISKVINRDSTLFKFDIDDN